MLARLLAFIAIVPALGLPLGAAQAGEPFVPSWIKNDPGTKSVMIELVADWSEHVRYAVGRTDISDFNGYWGGGVTIIAPTGWTVRAQLSNRSQTYRHSLMVTKPYPQTQMPVTLTEQDAVWGAHTTPLEGIAPGETAEMSFVAQEPGSYYLACARRMHLVAGHWIGFEVRDGLEQTVAVINEEKVERKDDPVRH